MAIPANGYAQDDVAYTWARTRFINNFESPTITPDYQSALNIAGDIINANGADVWLGKARPGLTGGRVWPRQTDTGQDQAPYLTATLPLSLIQGYYWMAVAVALAPEHFGTSTSASTSTSLGGDFEEIGYGNFRLKKRDNRVTTTRGVSTEPHSFLDSYAYAQAESFLKPLARPGKQIRIPGVERQPVTPKEKGYFTLSDFCIPA